MKHLFISLAFLTCVGISTVFATDVRVSDMALHSFHTRFSDATNPLWTEVNGMYRVEFMQGSQKKYAYYNPSGELIVVGEQISRDKLPQSLQQDLKSRFTDYSLTDVYQFSTEEKTDYYIVLENSDKQITLCSDAKKWRTFQVRKK